MKIVPRRRVRSYYWSCGYPEHRHSSPDIAVRCIVKAEFRANAPDRRWPFAKYVDVQQRREAGQTFREIGQHFGLSATRIMQALYQWERWLIHMEREHPRRTPDKRWGHYYNPNPDGSETLYLVRPDATGERFAATFLPMSPVPHIPREVIAERWWELRAKSRAFRYKQGGAVVD